MALRDSTQFILGSEKPSEWLALADMYINTYNQMPDVFVLPAEHAALKPIIESFHADTESFLKYIQAVRDQYQPGDERASVHAMYRTILTRSVQQTRRARRSRAVAAVERALRRPLDPDEREKVANKMEQHWALRRREALKRQRDVTVKGRLSTDVQACLLNDFWAEVDAEIDRGDLPIFKL